MNKDWQKLVSSFLYTAKKPLIVILGPTASGKTALSIEMAQWLIDEQSEDVEIVNADSRQIYEYLDIGTAKITKTEMRDIPHYLISILDPKQPVSIAWYQRKATKVIDDILMRRHVPMLVGGSMLYISAIIDGLQPIVESNSALRSQLEARYDEDGGIGLFEELRKADPESAAAIAHENKVYVVRAMEIFLLTGRPKSKQKTRSVCPYDLLILGVSRQRDELRQRINDRTRQLLYNGWIEEVQSLLQKEYTGRDPGMISHGYREIIKSIEKNDIDIDKLCQDITKKTRSYAKRQMTWWKDDVRIHWLRFGNDDK